MSCSTGEGEPWYNQVLLHDYHQSQILDAVKRTYLNFCSCCGERRRRKMSNLAGGFSFFVLKMDFKALTEATSGAVGGLLSTTLLYPLDTCKTKYQAEAQAGEFRKYR